MSPITPHSHVSTTVLPIAMRIALLPAIPLVASLVPMELMRITALELDSARLVALLSLPGSETQLATSISACLSALHRFSETPQAIVSVSQSAPPTSSPKTIPLDNVLLDASPALTAITFPASSTPWTAPLVLSPMTPLIYAMSVMLLLEPGVILFPSDA